jgi:hypothetical protein
LHHGALHSPKEKEKKEKNNNNKKQRFMSTLTEVPI